MSSPMRRRRRTALGRLGLVAGDGSEILLAHPRQVAPVSADENTRLVQSAYEAFRSRRHGGACRGDGGRHRVGESRRSCRRPERRNVQRRSGAGLAVSHRLSTSRRSSHESSSPRTTKWCPWCTRRHRLGAPAALLSITRHTCGHSGMGRSPVADLSGHRSDGCRPPRGVALEARVVGRGARSALRASARNEARRVAGLLRGRFGVWARRRARGGTPPAWADLA